MLSMHKALSMLERDENKLARIEEKTRETTEQALQAVAVVGVAGGLGYVNNRYGVNGNFLLFKKLPLDLTLGIGLHVLAFSGAGGRKYSTITHDAADGALAAYGYRMGSQFGATALLNGPQATTQGTLSGYYPAYAFSGNAGGPLGGYASHWGRASHYG